MLINQKFKEIKEDGKMEICREELLELNGKGMLDFLCE